IASSTPANVRLSGPAVRRVPGFEAAARRAEVGRELGLELLELGPELRQAVVDDALRVAGVQVALGEGDRGSALGARHEARERKWQQRDTSWRRYRHERPRAGGAGGRRRAATPAPRLRDLGRVRRRDGAELLEHAEGVPVGPLLGDLAAGDPGNAD